MSMRSYYRVFHSSRSSFLLLTVLILTLAHCGGDSASSRTGTVRIRLADAPFPYQHVHAVEVTIARVDIRQTGTSNYSAIMPEPRTFDLLTLQGGTTDVLGSAALSTHSYDQVRMKIESVSLRLTDGRTFAPVVADSLKDGMVVKMASPIQVKGNRTIELVLDFDVNRSFIAQDDPAASGGISGFVFKPSVRVADLSTVGSITGSVKHNNRTPSILTDDLPVRGLQVSVFQAGSPDTASTVTDDTGSYAVFFLPAGQYTVAADATDSTTAWSLSGVVVTTANPTRQDALSARR